MRGEGEGGEDGAEENLLTPWCFGFYQPDVMPSIKRKVFGFIRQFSSATGTSGSVLEEAEDAVLQQIPSEEEEPQPQSFIVLYLNG